MAEHVRLERERRGWSTAELARHVSSAGVSMSQSAVWRIENGEPRRKISVDELVAFARVFNKTIDDLLAPIRTEYPEQVVEAYARRWVRAERTASDARLSARTAFSDLANVVASFPGALPHVPRLLEKLIERHEADYVRGEIESKVPEIARYLTVRGKHAGHLDDALPLISHWASMGLSVTEMFEEAKQVNLQVPFYDVVKKLSAIYDSGMSVGAKLRQARQLLEVPVDQLAENCRLSVERIEAIEADDYSRLGEGVQRDARVRRTVRKMAEHLALDPNPLTDQYDAENAVDEVPPPQTDPFTQKPVRRVVRRKKPDAD
ncbi:helix-turn-helix domain-containing protein [Streptomyces rochei]|uniref:helix-turn-helix domain-containing protein n=1 Tax=Streptomyces rochei TaxID=1928 RepID=UPI0036B8CAFE